MENTPENYNIVLKALDGLSWMQRYPEEPAQIKDRVRRLMKIAHNKTCLEVIEIAIKKYGLPSIQGQFMWDHDFVGEGTCGCETCKVSGKGAKQKFHGRHTERFGSSDRNDLDWLIDTIGEKFDELPTQRGIREIYSTAGLRPADGKRIQDVEGD